MFRYEFEVTLDSIGNSATVSVISDGLAAATKRAARVADAPEADFRLRSVMEVTP